MLKFHQTAFSVLQPGAQFGGGHGGRFPPTFLDGVT